MSLDLSALADLEWLLRPEGEAAGRDPTADRELGRRLIGELGVDPTTARRRADEDPAFRRELALAWLVHARSGRRDLPGAWLGRAQTLAAVLLLVLGLVFGGGAAKALLAYDGSEPINVLPFLSVFFGAQILLLVLMLLFVLGSHRPGRTEGHRSIAWLVRRLAGRRAAVGEVLDVLRARRGLYVDVERWSFFALAQIFGVAFNFAALVVTVHAVAFTDLVFSWSTTLDLDAGAVHSIVRLLGLPWSFLPGGIPSLDVIAESQWVRMPGAFLHETTPGRGAELAARWWPFLVCGLVTYGLLPRACALLGGTWMRRRALDRVGFDHAGFQELFDRLLPRGASWQSPAPIDVRGAAPVARGMPDAARPPETPGAPYGAVFWGSAGRWSDALTACLADRFGAPPSGRFRAGVASLDEDRATGRALHASGADRVVFTVAAGCQPTADIRDYLRELRVSLGASVPVVVLLIELGEDGLCVDAEADERQVWRRALAAEGDPYLWVGRLREEPEEGSRS